MAEEKNLFLRTSKNALSMIQSLLVKDSCWMMENYNVFAIIIMLFDFVKIIAVKRFNAKESRRIILWDIMACVQPYLKGMHINSAFMKLMTARMAKSIYQ